MGRFILACHQTSFTGRSGMEIFGSGYWLPEREPPNGFYRFKVAGVSHRREELQSPTFEPGSELALVPEPENPHDPDALGIWDAARELQVGYVPADRARLIGRRLRAGKVTRAISLWQWRDQNPDGSPGPRTSLEILVAPDVEVVLAERPV